MSIDRDLKTFETPKGTVLPLLILRGQRSYLEVKYRLVWFREERPAWAIETEILKQDASSALVRAIVRDEAGRLLATAHKIETKQGFHDFIEKAETGAIGRALALLGYGTQFAPELDEDGDRPVDSPAERTKKENTSKSSSGPSNTSQTGKQVAPKSQQVPSKQTTASPADSSSSKSAARTRDPEHLGDFKCSFGKTHKGKRLADFKPDQLASFISWLEGEAEKSGRPLSDEGKQFCFLGRKYLKETGHPMKDEDFETGEFQ